MMILMICNQNLRDIREKESLLLIGGKKYWV